MTRNPGNEPVITLPASPMMTSFGCPTGSRRKEALKPREAISRLPGRMAYSAKCGCLLAERILLLAAYHQWHEHVSCMGGIEGKPGLGSSIYEIDSCCSFLSTMIMERDV